MRPFIGAVLVTIVGELVAQEPARAAPGSLTVRCIDTAGKPIENAEVQVFELLLSPKLLVTRLGETMLSGADGSCAPIATTKLETWHEYWVYARVPDKLVGMQSTNLFGNRDGNVTVKMVPSRRVSGTVRTPAETDVAAVRIRISDLSEQGMESTGPTPLPIVASSRAALLAELRRAFPLRFESAVVADGSFHLDDVPSSFGLCLEASGPGLADTQCNNLHPGAAEAITVPMAAEGIFGGIAGAPDGKAAANATVTLQLATKAAIERGLTPTSFAATTAPDGRFEIRRLPAGEFVLSVQTDAGCYYPQRLNLAPAEHRVAETLLLEAGVEISGVVRAADDKSPVANVSITIAGQAARFANDTFLARVRTDAKGCFTVRVPKGPAWLTTLPRRPFAPTEPLALDLTRPGDASRQLEILLQRR
jgi:hypothetical protein